VDGVTTTMLTEDRTGAPVLITTAQLPQQCMICGSELDGRTIVSVGGDGKGWSCAEHLPQRLAALPPARPLPFTLERRYTARYRHEVLPCGRGGPGLEAVREALARVRLETPEMRLDDVLHYPDHAFAVLVFSEMVP
jgi:hypothetical protein